MVIEQYSSSEITELAKAMLQVQQQLSPARKDGQNPFTNSRYSTLGSVMETCRKILITNGIWVTQYPVPVDAGHLGLVTKLVHAESGQWQSSLLMMPLAKNDPQGYGSAITYARRYALSALVGIITENDDDAESACNRGNTRNSSGKNPKTSPAPQFQKTPDSSKSQNHQNHSSGTITGDSTTLPKLDGVRYQSVQTQDGRECITATGDTMTKREILKEAGFRWSAERKIWWKYSDAKAA